MMATLGSTTAAAHDVTKTLPPVIYASFRAATAAWNSDLNEDGVSPFRAENYDLLQRAVTREAALSALADLEQLAPTSSAHAASALWLRERIEAHAPLWEAPPRNQLAGLFLLELLTASPAPKTIPADEAKGIERGLGLVDPATVAAMVLEQRQQIAHEWSEAMSEYVPGALQELLVESLQLSLEAEQPQG